MKCVFALFFALGAASAIAQEAAPASMPVDPAMAFAIRPVDENSPFFLDAEMARLTATPGFQSRLKEETLAEYPKSKNAPDTIAGQISGFFTGMFSSVRLGSLRTAPTTTKLDIEPTSFSLKDRRELAVTYSVRNNTKDLMRLDYLNGQRIDILTYDSEGKVIDRWSDDRSFEVQEGIVIINPRERIEYEEKIPTRDMKAGQTYKIEALTASEPNFISQEFITPQ